MAINKESNGYTFMFAIALVVVVGAALAIWYPPYLGFYRSSKPTPNTTQNCNRTSQLHIAIYWKLTIHILSLPNNPGEHMLVSAPWLDMVGLNFSCSC